MRISIFGLGYVGIVSAACLSHLGHTIIGVDIAKYKVDLINKGILPIKEKNLDKLISKAMREKLLKATTSTKDAILSSDISFICVGTPPKRNGDLDLSALESVCGEIGSALRAKGSKEGRLNHIIVIRSTMFPGSLSILKNILEKSSGKKEGLDFYLATNPEFLREGSAIKDFFKAPYIVVGSENKEVGKKVLSIYSGIHTKKFIVKPEIAQMIKYASNSFHALKVTFANEIGSVCKELGIDGKKLMGLFCEDNQLNISSYYLKPGFAYGGSCLPKDLAALKNNANNLKLNTPLLDSISLSNLEHIKRGISLIESKKKKKIGILGITFKADTDDIRGNPILYIINTLLNKDYKIKIFDPLISDLNLKNISNSYRKEVYDLVCRENLKDKIVDISNLFSDIDSVLKQDIIIVSNQDKSLKKYLINLNENQSIIDLQGIFIKEKFKSKYISLN